MPLPLCKREAGRRHAWLLLAELLQSTFHFAHAVYTLFACCHTSPSTVARAQAIGFPNHRQRNEIRRRLSTTMLCHYYQFTTSRALMQYYRCAKLPTGVRQWLALNIVCTLPQHGQEGSHSQPRSLQTYI